MWQPLPLPLKPRLWPARGPRPAGAHVLVGTPPQVLHAATCDQPYLDLSELQVVVADEVDEASCAVAVGMWALGALLRVLWPNDAWLPFPTCRPFPQPPLQLMRAYPSSFRAILDLVSGNGLEGDDLRQGQVVPWPAWHQQRQQDREQQQQQQQSSGAGDSDGAVASSDTSASPPSRSRLSDVGTSAGSGSPTAANDSEAAVESGSYGPGSETGKGAPASATPRPLPAKPQVVLVGATVTDAEMEEAVRRHWVTEPVVVRVGAPNRVPKGLRHRALVVEDNTRALAALVAMLRRDLAQAGQDEEPARVRC